MTARLGEDQNDSTEGDCVVLPRLQSLPRLPVNPWFRSFYPEILEIPRRTFLFDRHFALRRRNWHATVRNPHVRSQHAARNAVPYNLQRCAIILRVPQVPEGKSPLTPSGPRR